MDEKNFEVAVKLRGRSFQRNLATYRLLTKPHTPLGKEKAQQHPVYNMAVMNIGAPAGGMNAALRSFVRMGIHHRCNVYGVKDSFEGLANGKFTVCFVFAPNFTPTSPTPNFSHTDVGMGRCDQSGDARRLLPRHTEAAPDEASGEDSREP